jgi:hypothetical protein
MAAFQVTAEVEGDLRIRQGELDLKLKELDAKVTEAKKGFWHTSPLILAVVALLGTGIGAAVQGFWNTDLERKKFESSLILKSLETTDKKQAANNLLFLVNAGLVASLDNNKIKELANDPKNLPVQTALGIKIISPVSFDSINVPVEDGAGAIQVSGTSEKVYGTDYHIYVCSHVTKPRDDKFCWFDSPVTPEPDGTWNTKVYAGSSEYPITKNPEGTTVAIQAIVATDQEVLNEIGKHENKRYFDEPSIFKIRSVPLIEVIIKPQAQ